MEASRLKVEQLFGGTNYLEDLKDVSIDKLRDKGYKGTMIKGTPQSIFNKFSYFTYSNFVNGVKYDAGNHFIGYSLKDRTQNGDDTNEREIQNLQAEIAAKRKIIEDSLRNKGQADRDALKAAANNEEKIASIKASAQAYAVRNQNVTLANPTASNIINWASAKSTYSVTGFQPYSMTDFIFCKNYGRIPNNRLITLRRYPFPVDDQLVPTGFKQPLPIAQAVTWWGGDTGNTLSSIGVMKWNLRWATNTVTAQDIMGNEVLVSDVLQIFKNVKGGDTLVKGLEIAYASAFGNNASLQQLTGIEKNMQTYIKGLYETNGPYWNRVFGPVNVIDKSLRRERGMQDGWDQDFKLNFHYSFRSFNGLSPKIVALDLIASFLNLTYADAQFLGQLQRYFANPGLKFDPTTGELLGNLLTKYAMSFETGDMTAIMKLARKTLDSIKTAVGKGVDIVNAAAEGDRSVLADSIGRAGQAVAMDALSKAIPKFISARSALSDRPIGEWHLVVGNPMNPIMVMGDLVCTGASMQFDEELGPDDFPTGVTFTVNLRQGKPRDKTAIERIFNLGQTKLLRSPLRNPSSTEDTMGPANNKNWETVKKAIGPDGLDKIREELGYNKDADSSFLSYRGRIRKAYRYAADSNDPKNVSSPYDDSLLWLYFERRQNNT